MAARRTSQPTSASVRASSASVRASGASVRATLSSQPLLRRARVYLLALSVVGTERYIARFGWQRSLEHAERLAGVLGRGVKTDGGRGSARAATSQSRHPHLHQDLQHATTILGSSSLCLPHSLVGWVCYRALGEPVELVHGVRRVGHRWDFHAWLERQGEVVFSTDDEMHTWTRLDGGFGHVPRS